MTATRRRARLIAMKNQTKRRSISCSRLLVVVVVCLSWSISSSSSEHADGWFSNQRKRGGSQAITTRSTKSPTGSTTSVSRNKETEIASNKKNGFNATPTTVRRGKTTLTTSSPSPPNGDDHQEHLLVEDSSSEEEEEDSDTRELNPSQGVGRAATAASNSINHAELKRASTHLLQYDEQQTKDPQPQRVEFVADTKLPTDVGHFRIRAYRIARSSSSSSTVDGDVPQNDFVGNEPCVIYAADHPPFGEDGRLQEEVPVRVHDQCMTSEVFRSQRCDCKEQLKMTMEWIQENGGCIIYLQQEGRGIGLANKVAAYAMQDVGLDTVDANLQLGFPEDCRHYGVVPSILEDLGVSSIRLITNNPRKVHRLEELEVSVVGTIPMVVPSTNAYNRQYLQTKHERMSHANMEAIMTNDNETNTVAMEEGDAFAPPIRLSPLASRRARNKMPRNDDARQGGS